MSVAKVVATKHFHLPKRHCGKLAQLTAFACALNVSGRRDLVLLVIQLFNIKAHAPLVDVLVKLTHLLFDDSLLARLSISVSLKLHCSSW